MNARLETNLIRDWRPGWSAGIASCIVHATASADNAPRLTRSGKTVRRWKRIALRAVVVLVVVCAWVVLR